MGIYAFSWGEKLQVTMKKDTDTGWDELWIFPIPNRKKKNSKYKNMHISVESNTAIDLLIGACLHIWILYVVNYFM